MCIRFWHSCGFCGSSYSMDVDGEHHSFGFEHEDESRLLALKILKDTYGIDFNPDDVKFVWDGTL